MTVSNFQLFEVFEYAYLIRALCYTAIILPHSAAIDRIRRGNDTQSLGVPKSLSALFLSSTVTKWICLFFPVNGGGDIF